MAVDEETPTAPAAPEAPASPTAPVDEGTPPAPKPGDEGDKPAAPGTESEPAKPEAPAEGAEPDKPAKPEDKPADEEPKPPGEAAVEEDKTPDIKSMTRAERAQYFQNLDATTRKQVEAKVNEVYQPQAIDELKQKYIDDGHTEFEASMLAREEVRDQEADISRARAERAELNASLAADAMEVLGTIDWLNPAKKDAFDKVSSDAATELYDELCLTRDENTAQLDANGKAIPGTGQIIGATMTPKQFYSLIDTIRGSGTEAAKLSAQKAAEEEMASVAAPSSNSNKRDKAFDELSTAEKREKLLAKGVLIT